MLKYTFKKRVDLLIEEEDKKHYVPIKDFNTFMYDHNLHCESKHFCLQVFGTEEILECHTKDCFKINDNQRIKMPKKDEYVRFKDYESKIKLSNLIYANVENSFVAKTNEKQKPKKSYTKKYIKYVACSYSYKSVCVDEKLSHIWENILVTILLVA